MDITINIYEYHAHSVIQMWRDEGYEPFRIERWRDNGQVRITLRPVPSYLSKLSVTPDGHIKHENDL